MGGNDLSRTFGNDPRPDTSLRWKRKCGTAPTEGARRSESGVKAPEDTAAPADADRLAASEGAGSGAPRLAGTAEGNGAGGGRGRDPTGRSRAMALVGGENLHAMSELRDGPGLAFLAGHAGALAATGWLLALSWGSWWTAPAVFVHGVIVVHLFAPFHEAVHGHAFRTPWLNRVVGWLTGAAIMIPPTFFRAEHFAHHTHTNHPERDPQRIPMAESLGGYVLYASALPYFHNLLTSLARYAAGRFTVAEAGFLDASRRARVQREAIALWTVYGACAAWSLAFESWAAAAFWWLPRVAGEPVMRFIRMSEHVGCPLTADVFRNTRTVLTFAPLRWLAWNMAYHAEHHVFPGVPFHRLGRLHRSLKGHLEQVERGYARTHARLVHNAFARPVRS